MPRVAIASKNVDDTRIRSPIAGIVENNAIDEVAGIVVVLHPSHVVRFAGLPVVAEQGKPVLIAEGGSERSDSVRAGLSVVPAEAGPIFSSRVFQPGRISIGGRCDRDCQNPDS